MDSEADTKKCEYCHKSFIPNKSNAKYCSNVCRQGISRDRKENLSRRSGVPVTSGMLKAGRQFVSKANDSSLVKAFQAMYEEFLSTKEK